MRELGVGELTNVLVVELTALYSNVQLAVADLPDQNVSFESEAPTT
jgi:hypothetical protein